MAFSRTGIVYADGSGGSPLSVTIPAGSTLAVINCASYSSGSITFTSVTLDGQAINTLKQEANGPIFTDYHFGYFTGFSTGSGKSLAFSTDNTPETGPGFAIAFYSDATVNASTAAQFSGSGSDLTVTSSNAAEVGILVMSTPDTGVTASASSTNQTEVSVSGDLNDVQFAYGFANSIGASTTIMTGGSDEGVHAVFALVDTSTGGGGATVTASPAGATIVIQGLAPSLTTENAPKTSRGPGGEVVVFQGLAPTALARLEKGLSPAGEVLTFVGYAPSTATENAPKTSRAPSTETVVFQGLTPSTTTANAPHTTRAPGTATVVFNGYAPTGVYQILRQTLAPGTAVITFVGSAPTGSTTAPPRPGTATMLFQGLAPTTKVKRKLAANPTVGTIEFIGLTPSLGRQLQDWVAVAADTESWTDQSATASSWIDLSATSGSWTNIAKIWDST